MHNFYATQSHLTAGGTIAAAQDVLKYIYVSVLSISSPVM